MSEKEINFEQAMKELEEITKELENNELDLDSAVNKFEQGMNISKRCKKILDEAEKRITILIKDRDEYKEENFNTEE